MTPIFGAGIRRQPLEPSGVSTRWLLSLAPMTDVQFHVRPERPDDAPKAEALVAEVFGPGRYAKSAYRLREGLYCVAGLSFVAEDSRAKLVGTIRYWPVQIGDQAALLLGPIAIAAGLQGQGIGLKLMQVSLDAARAQGHRIAILVGDEPYYARVGFAKLPKGALVFPGPVDPNRLLGLALQPGALEGLKGTVYRPHLDHVHAAAGAPLAPLLTPPGRS